MERLKSWMISKLKTQDDEIIFKSSLSEIYVAAKFALSLKWWTSVESENLWWKFEAKENIFVSIWIHQDFFYYLR